MADDLVHPTGKNLKPMMAGPMQPLEVSQMIEAAEVVAGNRNRLDAGLAEGGHGTRHVARAGDEKKSLQSTLLHQCRDLQSLIMRVTAYSDAVQLYFEGDMSCEVVTNRIRLRKRLSLMRISATSKDQKWSLPSCRKSESGAQSVSSNFQMKSRGLRQGRFNAATEA